MSGDGKRGDGHRPPATAPIFDSTNPDLQSGLRSGRYRVITDLQHHQVNTATVQHPATQPIRSALQQLHDIGFAQPMTRAGRPLWSVASRTRRLWLLLNRSFPLSVPSRYWYRSLICLDGHRNVAM